LRDPVGITESNKLKNPQKHGDIYWHVQVTYDYRSLRSKDVMEGYREGKRTKINVIIIPSECQDILSLIRVTTNIK
jgi:hypothetical protein